jgi:hypothetical protein
MAQWERLVTEGHVRAARWRAAVKFVVVLAVCLIVVGLAGIRIVPAVQSASRIVQAKQELVTARQRALTAFIADKGAPPTTLPVDAANAIRPDQVGDAIEQLLGSLKMSNALPQEIKSLDPKIFWSGEWTPGAIAAVGGGSSILIGFYVNAAPLRPPIGPRVGPQAGNAPVEQPRPQLFRVFGLFHRSNESWSFYCLAVPRAAPCGQLNLRGETIFPPAIPETMRKLIPQDARP